MNQIIESSNIEEAFREIRSLNIPKGDLIRITVETAPPKQQKKSILRKRKEFFVKLKKRSEKIIIQMRNWIEIFSPLLIK